VGLVGHHHTMQSHFWTRLRQWEACTSKRSHLDEGEGCRPPPHRAEPFSDSPAAVEGAHGPVCVGRRHTMWSHSRTHPWRWEARTGKTPTIVQPHRRRAHGQTACTAPLLSPCKTRAKKKAGTLPKCRLARGRTACPAPLQVHPRSTSSGRLRDRNRRPKGSDSLHSTRIRARCSGVKPPAQPFQEWPLDIPDHQPVLARVAAAPNHAETRRRLRSKQIRSLDTRQPLLGQIRKPPGLPACRDLPRGALPGPSRQPADLAKGA
jgi:hypothetical protein